MNAPIHASLALKGVVKGLVDKTPARGPGQRTSVIASLYRKDTSVETLYRVYAVTGNDFPISGDAPLRMVSKQLWTARRRAEQQARERFHQDPTPDNLTTWCNANDQLVDALA